MRKVYTTSGLHVKSTWKDKSGERHERTEVQADTVIFLDGRQMQAEAPMPEGELPDVDA